MFPRRGYALFWVSAARRSRTRAAGGTCRKIGLNWFIPALVKSSVGSSRGTTEGWGRSIVTVGRARSRCSTFPENPRNFVGWPCSSKSCADSQSCSLRTGRCRKHRFWPVAFALPLARLPSPGNPGGGFDATKNQAFSGGRRRRRRSSCPAHRDRRLKGDPRTRNQILPARFSSASEIRSYIQRISPVMRNRVPSGEVDRRDAGRSAGHCRWHGSGASRPSAENHGTPAPPQPFDSDPPALSAAHHVSISPAGHGADASIDPRACCRSRGLIRPRRWRPGPAVDPPVGHRLRPAEEHGGTRPRNARRPADRDAQEHASDTATSAPARKREWRTNIKAESRPAAGE